MILHIKSCGNSVLMQANKTVTLTLPTILLGNLHGKHLTCMAKNLFAEKLALQETTKERLTDSVLVLRHRRWHNDDNVNNATIELLIS